MGYRALFEWSAWGWNLANRAVAPGWHLAQVVTTLAPETDEAGSATARTVWAPWQSAHLATRVMPSVVTLPWKGSRYVRSDSSWQLPHSRMTSSCHGAPSTRRIWWAEWQSVQTGAVLTPLAVALPWTLSAYCARSPAGHAPQVFGTF